MMMMAANNDNGGFTLTQVWPWQVFDSTKRAATVSTSNPTAMSLKKTATTTVKMTLSSSSWETTTTTMLMTMPPR